MEEQPTGFPRFKNKGVKMNLSDAVISHIARLIQIGILTGTDVVDNIRMIRLVVEGNQLELDSSYELKYEENLEKMLEKANSEEG